MEIPKFNETFNPILTVLKDSGKININQLKAVVIQDYYSDLSELQLKEETSSGANLLKDRIYWGTVYLKQGLLLERPERGYIEITNKGKQWLESNDEVTLEMLRNDADFINHEKKQYIKRDKSDEIKKPENVSPQDMIDFGFTDITNSLKNDLLDKLKESNPYYFEKIILHLFQKMGYGDFQETKKSGDGGIDGIINQDALGVEKIYTQAKRYTTSNVGERDIRNFKGAMDDGEVSKGIFVTTSDFDTKAIESANNSRNKIILINGKELVKLMIKYNLGVQVRNEYLLKEIDEDFFIED